MSNTLIFSSIPGFAQEIGQDEVSTLPFIVNWAGGEVKSMEVDDFALQETLVELIRCIDELQPKITGKFNNFLF